MHVNYRHKRNDRLPKLRMTLKDKNGPVDLTTGTVFKFFMRPYGGGNLKVNGAGLTVVNAVGGIVEYPWLPTDVDTAGFYEAEVQVTFGANGNETFPNNGQFVIEIVEDLGS